MMTPFFSERVQELLGIEPGAVGWYLSLCVLLAGTVVSGEASTLALAIATAGALVTAVRSTRRYASSRELGRLTRCLGIGSDAVLTVLFLTLVGCKLAGLEIT